MKYYFRHLKKGVLFLLAILIVCIFLVPIVYLILGSFKPVTALFDYPPKFIFKPSFLGYKTLFSTSQFSTSLINTIIYAIVSVVIALPISALLAYALLLVRGISLKTLAYSVLIFYIMPPMVFILPYYLMFNKMNLLNTKIPIIAVYTALHIPFMTWLLRGFFSDLGTELTDAAQVDGCTLGSAFFRVLLPTALPGIAVVSIFSIIGAWNEFLFAAILTTATTKTAPVFISIQMGPQKIEWGIILSGMTVTILPLLIIAWFLQRYILRGLSLGAIKG